jgi:hypothetical protein
MVDMLTEENKMLRQEMEAFREKVSKLQKVGSKRSGCLTTPTCFIAQTAFKGIDSGLRCVCAQPCCLYKVKKMVV